MSRSARTLLAITAATGAALSLMAAASSPAPAGRDSGPALPRLHSLYVPMPDGVRLAVDVWLPAGTTAGARLPTVLETDRYWRARAYAGGIKDNPNYQIALPWNRRGYAYVFADLRGTGASFGTLTAELGSVMIADVGSLADWIAAQPWSNGRVGVTGVSYSGDTAMLSLALRNPHITAAAPISYDFDPYEDLARPGGILIQPLIDPYALLLRILDKAGGTTCATSAETEQVCQEVGLTGAAPEPVDGPHGEALLAAGARRALPQRQPGRHGHRRGVPQLHARAAELDGDQRRRQDRGHRGGRRPDPDLRRVARRRHRRRRAFRVHQHVQHAGGLDRAVEPRPGLHRRPVRAQPPADRRGAPAARGPGVCLLRPLREERRAAGRQPPAALLHAERGHLAHHRALSGARDPDAPALLRGRARARVAPGRPAVRGPAAPRPGGRLRHAEPVEHQPDRAAGRLPRPGRCGPQAAQLHQRAVAPRDPGDRPGPGDPDRDRGPRCQPRRPLRLPGGRPAGRARHLHHRRRTGPGRPGDRCPSGTTRRGAGCAPPAATPARTPRRSPSASRSG